MSEERGIRLSQTLVPFGVGAIYDLRGESLVACDISYWKGSGKRVTSKRLAKALGVEGFRSAPAHVSLFGGSGARVPYYRFPQWLFCQNCRRMAKWSTKMEVDGEPPRCSCKRKPQLVPMRFVMACPKGHLGDVPWEYWAHFGAKVPAQKQCRSKDLRFIALAGSGAGLESLRIECNTCGAKRSLAGITSKETVKAMHLKCPGKQPWQYIDGGSTCDVEPVILQRGASNLYFAHVSSAIDIPPESEYEEYGDLTLSVVNHALFSILKSGPDGPIAAHIMEAIAAELECPIDKVRMVLDQELKAIEGAAVARADSEDLQTDEWRAFTTPQVEQHERSTFITRHVALLNEEERLSDSGVISALGDLIDRVVLATKLREVRALTGFSRYEIAKEPVPPDIGRGLEWLPAIEVFGEGIFFTLREAPLRSWEELPGVAAVATILEERRTRHFIAARLHKTVTPRFVLLHTLAHVLIRELSFQCGYSSSSLRERIYAGGVGTGDPQAGILIYTAAGDVEGTLGGLARQGEPPEFARTILAGLERAAWCSSDPICRESPGQGFGALNLGACHACALVSETSCESANVLLDRRLLFGVPGKVTGFFEHVLALAQSESARGSALTAGVSL